jgi:D-alanyl-D-alanine carboxypeptidase
VEISTLIDDVVKTPKHETLARDKGTINKGGLGGDVYVTFEGDALALVARLVAPFIDE